MLYMCYLKPTSLAAKGPYKHYMTPKERKVKSKTVVMVLYGGEGYKISVYDKLAFVLKRIKVLIG